MATTRREQEGTFGEEASAFGERTKGAVKDAYGSVTGNERIEREGEREKAEGNLRQERNDVFGSSHATTSTGTGRSWVTGSFADRESADRAYNSALGRGYKSDDINLMMSDDARKRHFSDADAKNTDLGNKALEGAGLGGAIGGATGGIIAAIAAIGTSLVLPGLGLVVAGPIAAGLAGAGAGGLTGGIIGALIGSGIPKTARNSTSPTSRAATL